MPRLSMSTSRLSGSRRASSSYVATSLTTASPYSLRGMRGASEQATAIAANTARLIVRFMTNYCSAMELDIFFSISETEVDGVMPDERTMLANFFEQVELADRLGFGTAWVAESHLSTEVQKTNPGAVIPHFVGEIGLNTDILQLAHRVFARTRRIGVGSAILNILCNGGPVAHAERIKTFLALHRLDPNEPRLPTIGFASGRFPFINIPYGIVPRNGVEEAAWPVMKNKIFEEA